MFGLLDDVLILVVVYLLLEGVSVNLLVFVIVNCIMGVVL